MIGPGYRVAGEGHSAPPLGSNSATPTIFVKEYCRCFSQRSLFVRNG
jgi:hypothetical protein